MNDRGSSRAVGGVSSQNLGRVDDGVVCPSICTSHEGGGGSDDGSGTHFDR